MPYFTRDDIAQIASPPGGSPIGAIRISGDNAFAILGRAATGLDRELAGPITRSVHGCRLALRLRPVDRPAAAEKTTMRAFSCPARAFLMPAPASYTRENVAEIHIPGSPPLLRAALGALVKAGARPAAPGEFTFRAFANGRISLGQAEAVEAVVRAGNETERRAALSRLDDSHMERIRLWREDFLQIAASLEAVLDFSEEELEDNVLANLEGMAKRLDSTGKKLAADGGGAGRELPHIALVGLTNAGKSSLLNALVDEDSALVSPAPSTTRDSLKRNVAWHGVELVISDNPGHDQKTGGGGSAAAALSFERLGGEDVACWVVDASRPPDDEAREFAAGLSGEVVLVLNKDDLPQQAFREDFETLAAASGATITASVRTSARTSRGVPELRRLLAECATRVTPAWSRREAMELRVALECCRAAADELSGPGRPELAAEEVRRGVTAFSRALGEGYAEEALTRIFSRFCIGK